MDVLIDLITDMYVGQVEPIPLVLQDHSLVILIYT